MEVVVAIVVFQLGLLGVAATLVLSARAAATVGFLERAALEVEWTLDSLHESGWGGAGERTLTSGALTWWSEADGTVWVELAAARGGSVRMWTTLRAIDR